MVLKQLQLTKPPVNLAPEYSLCLRPHWMTYHVISTIQSQLLLLSNERT